MPRVAAKLIHAIFWWSGVAGAFAQPAAISLESLTDFARELAREPYDPAAGMVPAFLTELGYDQYRDFEYKPERALWRDEKLPFELIFFHPGYLYRKSVTMNVIDSDGTAVPFAFAPELFEYGPQADLIPRLPDGLGFSGFHVWQRHADGTVKRVGLFQGASYFRLVSPANEYGLSARAIAIDTTDGPEEFPDFTRFWFRKPAADADSFEFFGLAEGPSVVAAYRFVLTPGVPIRLQVTGRLVLRHAVKELGLSPFSTMFWYGENTPRPADFRPEVHDSDGLFVDTGLETLWRPLTNPPRTRADVLPGDGLAAFGLLQRDRDYENYQDIEAHYHQRPDAWIVPGTGMRQGSLRLLEIESPNEYADNVALLWVPAAMPAPGEVFAFDYDLFVGERPAPALARVVATRYGESLRGDGSIEFVVDYAGGALTALAEDAEPDIDGSIDGGEFVFQDVRKNPYNDTWRLSLRVLPGAGQDEIRLRVSLLQNGERLGETWTYWWMRTR